MRLQCILSVFGFDDNLYSIYSTDLWRNTSVLGNNSSSILVVTFDDNVESRSVDRQKPVSSPVLFLPSSFDIPSSQQIWPYVHCSAKSRSEDGGSKFIQ